MKYGVWFKELSWEEYNKLPKNERFLKIGKNEEERAEELWKKFISIDIHSHAFSHANEIPNKFPTLRDSQTTAFIGDIHKSGNLDATVRHLGKVSSLIKKEPGFVICYNTSDIRKAKKNGNQAFMASCEVFPVENYNLENLDILYGLGVRIGGLTYDRMNLIGAGGFERGTEFGGKAFGLTYFGYDVVERINELGMIIDLSHVGVKTALEVIEASKDPVCFSHNCAHGCWPGPLYEGKYYKMEKCRTDEEIKALTEKDGIIGIESVANIISDKKKQSILDFLNHIDYIVNLVGVDYVAVGTDIGWGDHMALYRCIKKQIAENVQGVGPGWWGPPRGALVLNSPYIWGLNEADELPNIIRGLVIRGYSDQEIKKIIGENALKLIEIVVD